MSMLDFYRDEVHPLFPILLDMQQRGLHVDRARLDAVRHKLTTEVEHLQKSIVDRIGWIPNTKSYIDMGKLFQQLKIQIRTTAKGRPKTDEETMLSYAHVYPHTRDLLYDCVNITQRRTQLSGFTNMALDTSDFYHPSYDLGHAVTGRQSSEGAEEGGPQIQNIPVPIRRLFIPDDPTTDELTGADMKQAEAMVVAWLAEDMFLINAFESGKDVHRVRACKVFRDWSADSLPPDTLLASIKKVCDKCATMGETDCAHSERYLSKRTGHAFNYKMGVRKLLKILRAEGVFITEAEGNRIRSRVLSRAVVLWQDSIADSLRQSPWLETPLGRKREFYGIFDEDLVRKALSWLAQATVSQIKNRAMIYMYPKLPKLHARIVTETHDNSLINHPKNERANVYELLQEAYDTTMTIHNRDLTIPIDIGSGPSWGELEK